MTPDERNMLNDLASKFAQTPAPPKDSEAEDFIRTHIGNRPDALYLMTQTVLIQNLALQHAQDQLRELQQRSGQPAQVGSGSFLGGQGQQSRGGGGYAPSSGGQQQYAPPPPQYAAPQYAPPSPGSAPSGQPSFLRGAAQTAAGVAAGALAFEGIQSLFSHPGYGGGGGFLGGGPGFGGGSPVEETVVNNYYDNSGGGGDDYRAEDRDDYRAEERDDYQDQNTADDAQYDDSNYDNGGGDDGGYDDSGSNFS